MNIKEIVENNNMAKFSHAIAGVLYYEVKVKDDNYQFSIDMNDKSDVGTGTFPCEIKAITLMRWIRKAMDKNEFYKV